MSLELPSLRMTALSLGLAAALGAGTFVMAQTGALPGAPAAEQPLVDERQAIRAAERMARLEGRIAFLRARLQITAGQTPLWNTFAQALRDEQAARDRARAASPALAAGLPPITDRVARRRADLAERNQRLTAVANALTPLYAALSAEQKAIADLSLRTNGDGRIDIVRGRNRRS